MNIQNQESKLSPTADEIRSVLVGRPCPGCGEVYRPMTGDVYAAFVVHEPGCPETADLIRNHSNRGPDDSL